ncbi:hypothetical protein, variant 1 [Aphanomyces astaci]|uniref:DNA helicase n=1 Tax=Aphanomyces astaci TaxID=112090 RepID=W4H1Q8_APHAT|nr:hypothetical protein, variant 1 [Aphanomyces astaci]ETV85955.1 hypothetical protein, variant 1 [Aphanomyces astaci]|eukprot:XP_009824428.1 hypothetical protein, variant 1 [Aphanomyces astaci]
MTLRCFLPCWDSRICFGRVASRMVSWPITTCPMWTWSRFRVSTCFRCLATTHTIALSSGTTITCAVWGWRCACCATKTNWTRPRLEPETSIGDLKAHVVDQFVSVTGTVTRVNAIKPLVVHCEFLCEKCEGVTERYFPDGKYDPPASCGTCRSKSTLIPNRSAAKTVDFQKIKIQEVDNGDAAAGRIPRMVEVELTEDLVDSCVPGSIVTICGPVKAVNSEVHSGRFGKQAQASSLYVLYIVANSVVNHNQAETSKEDTAEFSPQDLDAIYTIAHDDQVFDRLIHSFCPGIYRNELVKAGLLLALFGGAQKKEDNAVFTRSDSHVLLVGDPGLGKSQMLRAVSMITPRGVYVGGNTATTTGLTVTMVKDSSGDYALEAGALVLADQGVCCIDEFDKMACDYQALLEAMEQQSISIAKAGIVCNLNARTSVIAAANPSGGHYNRSRSVSENLKMKAALLSRFDLIFVLLDRPDASRDELLSEHVMHNHLAHPHKRQRRHDPHPRFTQLATQAETDVTLKQRLVANSLEMQDDPISLYHIRRYIAYARKYIHPQLSQEARQYLQDKYLQMRSDAETAAGDGIPITMRQLESLIRLAQARAKIELQDVVTVQHAYDVVEIMQECLLDTYTTEEGHLDFGRSGGMSLAKKVKAYVARLRKSVAQRNSQLFSMDELLQVANSMALDVDDFRDFVEILRNECFVLKQGVNVYKVQI